MAMYKSLTLITVAVHILKRCLQRSGDGQAYIVTKTAAIHIVIQEPIINFSLPPNIKKLSRGDEQGEQPLGVV